MFYFLATILIITNYQQPISWLENDEYSTLRTSDLRIDVGEANKSTLSINADGAQPYTLACSVDVQVGYKGMNIEHPEIIKDSSRISDQLIIKYRYPFATVSNIYSIEEDVLLLKTKIEGKADVHREIQVNFILQIPQEMTHLFLPTSNPSADIQNWHNQRFVYRNDFYIPIVTVYETTNNRGLSIVVPFDVEKPHLSFAFEGEKLIVSYDYLHCSEKNVATAAIYIVPYQGDWRAGLSYVLNRYPDYFYPAVRNTKESEGWYIQGNVHDTEAKIKNAAHRGVRWSQFHYYFPFIGLYAPRTQDWGLISNSDAVSLDAWEDGAGINRNSYTSTQNLLNLWHNNGIQVYLYFQAFEAWHQYANKYFRNDIAQDESHIPLPSWKFTRLMNPDPDNRWGQYIIEQSKEILKKYPNIDGIFYDRMDYWDYDFVHSDGITMIKDTPIYMLGFAEQRINDVIFTIMHQAGKGIWGNGPTSIEVCKNLDGIMAEKHAAILSKVQYMGLVRPTIYLAYDKIPKDTEQKLKRCLLSGAFPSVTYGDEQCQMLDEAYRSMLDLMHSREWVLCTNPLDIPHGYQANIFRRPDSTYVAYVINPEKSRLSPHPFDYDIPVTINLPDAHKIEYVYLLSGDWSGVNEVAFNKMAQSIHISLPCHLAASALYLTKSSRYDVVRLSKPILIKDQSENLIFRVLNFDKMSDSTFTLELPWYRETKSITSEMITFHTQIPETVDCEVALKVVCGGIEQTMSCWIVDPISIAPKEQIFIKFQEGENVPFYIANNINEKCQIHLTGEFTEGEGFIQPLKDIVLQPHESRDIDVPIRAKTDGLIELLIRAHCRDIKKSFPVGAALPFSPDDMFHDDFSAGMTKWSVSRGNWVVSNNVTKGSGPLHLALKLSSDWYNYEFEVRTKVLGSTDPAIDWLKSYIFFRVQNENNFYRFGIHGGYDMISLYKYVNGTWSEIAVQPFVAQIDEWYTLKIKANGPMITGYVNGKEVIAVADTTFLSGGIGIGVLEDHMVTQYKDVVVKELNNY